MKKLLILSILAMLAVPVPVQAQKAQPAEVKASDGLLFKISGHGLKKPSYIFGTVHITCPEDMFSMAKLTGYLSQTDQLLLEVDMDNPAEMQAMATGVMIAGGKTFTEFLTVEEYKKVDEMLKAQLGIPLEAVKTIKPMLLSVMLLANPKNMGCATPTSYEASLVQAATEKKKPVEGLETAAFQFAVLDKTSIEKQAKDLAKMAADLQKYFDDFKKLITAYKLQSSGSLYDEMLRQTVEEKDFQTRLLDERNKVWVPKIEKIIKKNASFIAVGGGHLGGKNGVIQLLKAKGYTVSPLKL